jgi:hypothetical protein
MHRCVAGIHNICDWCALLHSHMLLFPFHSQEIYSQLYLTKQDTPSLWSTKKVTAAGRSLFLPLCSPVHPSPPCSWNVPGTRARFGSAAATQKEVEALVPGSDAPAAPGTAACIHRSTSIGHVHPATCVLRTPPVAVVVRRVVAVAVGVLSSLLYCVFVCVLLRVIGAAGFQAVPWNE